MGGKDSPTPAPALLWLCPWPPCRGPWALSQEAEWCQLTHTMWTCVGLSRVIFMTRKQGGNLDPRPNKTLSSVCIYCFGSCRSACTLKRQARTPLVVQRLRLQAPSEGGMGSTPGQGTRAHILQQRSRSPSATTKTRHSQIAAASERHTVTTHGVCSKCRRLATHRVPCHGHHTPACCLDQNALNPRLVVCKSKCCLSQERRRVHLKPGGVGTWPPQDASEMCQEASLACDSPLCRWTRPPWTRT